jgi:hypothetical protein
VADRYYYFEILHKVWWQGALLQLAWTGPGITDTTILRTPYIRPYVLTGGMTGAPARAVSRNAGALSLSLVGGTATTRAPVVRFSLPSDQGHVVLTLNDLQGRTVRRLVDGAVASGVHVVAISDRSNAVAPGTYLLRLRAGTTVKSMTITLSR